MDALTQLDARAVKKMVSDAPFTWTFGGADYTATMGARDTMKMLEEGGFVQDQEFRMLVELAQFGSSTRPAQREKITLYLNDDLIPVLRDESTSTVVGRIVQINRAGGGLTYTIRTENR